MNKDSLPSKFKKWKNLSEDWYYWLDENPKLSALDICINYIKSIHEIDKIIVGVDSCNQLEEVLKAYLLTEQVDFPEISCNDEQLLDPSNW
jgi:predicted aldo/keto reductase-like oxidoreductase